MLKIPKQYKSLKFVRPMKWDEVFGIWRKGEASQASWKKHWESRGFDSWDEWRTTYGAPLSPQELEWFLFEIQNPLVQVRNFFGVPSRSWIEKAYQGEKTKRLSEIVDLPIITDNDKVQAIKNDFPSETMLTGIINAGEIILYEGMHRAGAIASWDKQKKFPAKVFIALAAWEGDFPVVGGDYKK